MPFSLRSRLIAACIMLAAAFSSPAYSQKILAEGIKELATQIASNVSKEKKQKIAILPFRELDGKPTLLSSYISEELMTDLFTIGGLEIIERAMLDRLIGEIKLGQTGVVDPETARKVGKLAGVDAIVTGSITDLQSYVALNCRLIDTQTGRIFAAAQTKIVKDDDVRKIMGAAPLPSSEGEDDRPSAHRPEPVRVPKPIAAPKGVPQEQADNYIFELKRCALSGTSLDCEVLITNKIEDRSLNLSASNARLIDDEGNEYHARSLTLGGSAARPPSGRPSVFGGSSSGTTLARNIPVKALLSFEGIPPDTKRATLLELKEVQMGGVSSGRERFRVQFRNVPLERP